MAATPNKRIHIACSRCSASVAIDSLSGSGRFRDGRRRGRTIAVVRVQENEGESAKAQEKLTIDFAVCGVCALEEVRERLSLGLPHPTRRG